MEIKERKNLPIKRTVHKRIKTAAHDADISMQDYVERMFETFQAQGLKQDPTRYAKEKALIEKALDDLPEYASSQILAIEHLLKPAPKVNIPNAKKTIKNTTPATPADHAETGTRKDKSGKS